MVNLPEPQGRERRVGQDCNKRADIPSCHELSGILGNLLNALKTFVHGAFLGLRKPLFMNRTNQTPHARTLSLPCLLLSCLFLPGSLRAVPSPDAPSLSVQESAYGTVTREGHRENIEHLDLKIITHSTTGLPIRVECYFLKPGKHGAIPSVDDSVGFEITDPHGIYRVEAKPIPVKSVAKPPRVGKARTKGPAFTATTASPQTPPARFGYVVLITRDGKRLSEFFSDHAVETIVRDHPDLLANARVRILPSPPLAGR
jgi:hypothetical protein